MKKRSSISGDSRKSLTPALDDEKAVLDGDYSHVKVPSQQITIATFWTYMEQYFRNLTAEDMYALSSNVFLSYFRETKSPLL